MTTGTELAKKPANVVRTYTQQVRDHSSAMARLQDQYFANLKRAEAQYFDGVKRITEALMQASVDHGTATSATNGQPSASTTEA